MIAVLPADQLDSSTPRQVHNSAFSFCRPTPVASPRVIAVSEDLADQLGLEPSAILHKRCWAEILSGNQLPDGSLPISLNYGGHQFGNWAGQLGDGRAIQLGETADISGRSQTIQLKGAGPTPYSRSADGRAVLRSSIREFLCSEAMHHLGIPTTRALALTLTGETVVRDMFYDGHPAAEASAIVCRVAPSFLRFGSFELPAARGETDHLRKLVEFTIGNYYPDITDIFGDRSSSPAIIEFFRELSERTISLAVDWARVGFVHGVLNTDNMSALGLTMDYGPFGWLEAYDPDWTPNATDAGQRRYRFGNQAIVVQWNLVRLANALATLLPDTAELQSIVDGFSEQYQQKFTFMSISRIGLEAVQDGDRALLDELYAALGLAEIDQVIFFRNLVDVPLDVSVSDSSLLASLSEAFYRPTDVHARPGTELASWLRKWIERSSRQTASDPGTNSPAQRRTRMNAMNPKYVLRNYLAQEAIDSAELEDYGRLTDLLEVLQNPYLDQPGKDQYSARRPEWARNRVGCSMLSCSS